MELVDDLRESLSRICDIPVECISSDSTLDELGFDSLASAEVLTDLEIRLGKELPLDSLRRLAAARTVGDVAEILQGSFVDAMPGPSERLER